MNTFAIYTIIENGRKTYYSGKFAGGYRCPFYIYKCGNERYCLRVIAPDHKAVMFGAAGGR